MTGAVLLGKPGDSPEPFMWATVTGSGTGYGNTQVLVDGSVTSVTAITPPGFVARVGKRCLVFTKGQRLFVLSDYGVPGMLDLGISTVQAAIANNTETVVKWDVVNLNEGYTYSASTGQVTVPVQGRYRLSYAIGWTGGATAAGRRFSRLVSAPAGGGTGTFHAYIESAADATTWSGFASKRVILNAGDTVQLNVLQSTGGAISLQNSFQGTSYLQIEWLG